VFEGLVFRVFNSLPSQVGPLFEAVMQLGWFGSIFIVAAGLLAFRRVRLARDVLLAGNLAYVASILLKDAYGRGRPADLLSEVTVRDTFDTSAYGFPSGHVAVATAIVCVLAAHVPPRLRRYWWSLVPAVMVARMYVGAHLPLDVIGGALVGLASCALVQLVVGVEDAARDVAALTRRLRTQFGDLTSLSRLASDAHASSPFVATFADGTTRFLKVSSKVNLVGDQLHRTLRRVYFAHPEDLSPFLSNKQKVDHEAFVLLLAEHAGVRVPAFVALWHDPQADIAFLFQELIDGRSLDSLAPDDLPADVVEQAFRQLARLHGVGIAHRDLRPANLVLAHDGTLFLIDFGYAESSASVRQRNLDRAELMVSLALIADPKTVVDTFVEVFSIEDLTAILPFMQTHALSATTRTQLHKLHNPIPDIAKHAEEVTGTPVPQLEKLERVTTTQVLALLGALVGIHFLLPQVGELGKSLDALKSVNVGWALVAVLASLATYIAAGNNQRIASEVTVPLRTMVYAQFAASFLNRFTPVSVGSIVLSSRVMIGFGMERGAALAVASLPATVGVLTSTLLIAIASPSSLSSLSSRFRVAPEVEILVGVAAVSVLLGLFVLPFLRHRIAGVLRSALSGVRTLRSPAKFAKLAAGCLALSLLYVASLAASLEAFGLSLPFAQIFAVYFAGFVIGQASPVPGGLGATEAALVAGLSVFGVATAEAIGVVLVYRLATFWLPTLPGAVAMRWLSRKGYV